MKKSDFFNNIKWKDEIKEHDKHYLLTGCLCNEECYHYRHTEETEISIVKYIHKYLKK